MTNENELDTRRATLAAQAICNGRDPRDPANMGAIMVTLEHAVATVLIALFADPRKAVGMLNVGLAPGVEERIKVLTKK